MRFADNKLFMCDQAGLPQHQLIQILDTARDAITVKRFKLSGLGDLEEASLILLEWYRASTPKIMYKELLRESGTAHGVDDLYNEPSDGKRRFTRALSLFSHIQYADPEIKYEKMGQSFDQPVHLYNSLLDLYINDYWPEVGDEVIWLGRSYQITKVWVPVDAQWVHTGAPMHIACEAQIWRHGADKTGVPLPPVLSSAGMYDDAASSLMDRLGVIP
jgi:hypothetical protein